MTLCCKASISGQDTSPNPLTGYPLMHSEARIIGEERVRDDYPRVTAYCLPILQRASVSEVAEAEADVS